ncbi:haloacid dehalogenase-like hydrolase [Collinsella tanakaei]|uniref:DUF7916 family protein n=1 Tax=Collinsella tanakaei TaxID=626935 RepID=UPI001956CF27|nr:haloacid dehalogenase-like hydrolase [Collinsella tanakaei]MBM6867425.1 haloacid dehalogenase-like hydrolase [Collinsella tanakaei]
MKRLLNCETSDLARMSRQERLDAIEASEGRVIVQELSLFRNTMMLEPISDPEIACAFGADLILLNAFDCEHPHIAGIDCEPAETIRTLKRYTGRLVGLNLEPVGDSAMLGEQEDMPTGRAGTVENALRARDLGFDFILLTGNPGTGVDNAAILKATREMHEAVGDTMMIFAGKMHAAGSKDEAGENIVSRDMVRAFADAGADVILLPAPGTVPGVTFEFVHDMVSYIHSLGKLSLTAIGTSQEGASAATIEQIALMCKMTGTDLHHVGDAGVGGLNPENLMAYSIAIRGKRHTYLRMARSINR